MSNPKYYFLAFALMLAIYAVAFAGAWRQTAVVAESLKHRAEQIEQAVEVVKNQ